MNQAEINLVASAQKGEAEAFGALYDAYADKIYKFIYYKTHHRETAEDLVSLTFTKALEGLAGFSPAKGSFSSWLYKIARNNVIDHYRSFKSEADVDDIWDLTDSTDAPADADTSMRLAEVKKYFKYLSADQREILTLRVWEELSYKEIAEATGKTEQNCKVIFSRALAELRHQLPLAVYILLLLNK
jgi:RNA polymerase sigma-70 factor (ECF subfamily)